MAKTMKFFERMLTAFLRRQSPVSRVAKPAFIQKTSIPVTITQMVSAMTFGFFKALAAFSTKAAGSVGAAWARKAQDRFRFRFETMASSMFRFSF